MGIQYCKSFVQETFEAYHDFRTDVVMASVFGSGASFDENTTAYSATGEVSDSGYTAGGAALTLVATYPAWEGPRFCVRFSDYQWTFASPVTIRWILLYNASKSNRAILSIDMGSPNTVWGNFNLSFPLTQPPMISQGAPNII
jgi:hypothetical protein